MHRGSQHIFRNKLELDIPAEFHLAAVIFIFASLCLVHIQGHPPEARFELIRRFALIVDCRQI